MLRLSLVVSWLSWLSIALAADEIIHDIGTDLEYKLVDNTQLLKSHVFVYTPACKSDPFIEKDPLYGFVHYELAPSAAAQVFPGNDGHSCHAACLERGTDQVVAHTAMPYKRFPPQHDNVETLSGWFQSHCHRAEVCLMNYADSKDKQPIQINWLRPGTREPVPHIQVGYGERQTKCFHSFLGHEFQATTLDDPPTWLAEFRVEYTTVLAIGTALPSDDRETRSFHEEIKSTLHNEWDRHNRVERTFSPLGFQKGRLPDDVFASMRSFFHNNRGNSVLEEWGGRGVFVNWWETDCSFLQIPWDLKTKWQLRLLELVQAWAGGIAIEQTDMYGLRQYQEGARLLTHVDRITTHSVSLIVNIAQGNLTEPWPVEVHDHADRLHEVPMRPGDIVYYESAKCLHGRNRPLMGKDAFYVNLFTHYRPTGDPKWYEKPNHDGTPDPVLDVEGSCRMVPAGWTEIPSSTSLGTVQKLQCDDNRLGPYRSPTQFVAGNGHDLIEWWERTASPVVVGANTVSPDASPAPVCANSAADTVVDQ